MGEAAKSGEDLKKPANRPLVEYLGRALDATFAFLIGLADFIGQSLYPFPRKARYPLAQALEDGDLKSARAFLPQGFSDQPLLTPTELVELAQAISSKVKQLTEDMRQTVQ
jgi:hypothetical protein